MSQRSCEANQKLAKEAIDLVLENGNSLFTLTDQQANRMMVCGNCPESGIEQSIYKKAFRKSIDMLAGKISRFSEWGHNPEMTKINARESKKIYREKNKEHITKRNRTLSIDKRIEKLREEIACRQKSHRQ